MTETAILFGPRQALVGVLTEPCADVPPDRPAIILLNAGRIHHVGPNRIHVKVARRLAELGFVVLRFDFSGIGDSETRDDHLPYVQSVVAETQDAIGFLAAARGVRRCVLVGICSGAAAAIRTALVDPRVGGLALINVRGQVYDRRTALRAYARKFRRHYWKLLLFKPHRALKGVWLRTTFTQWRTAWADRWQTNGRKGDGRSAARNGKDGATTPGKPAPHARPRDQEVLWRLIGRGIQTLMVFSESDVGQDFLSVSLGAEMRRLRATGGFDLAVIPRSDHVFTRLESQARLADVLASWLVGLESARSAIDQPAGADGSHRAAEPAAPTAWD